MFKTKPQTLRVCGFVFNFKYDRVTINCTNKEIIMPEQQISKEVFNFSPSNLKEKRRALGLSQDELCKKYNISISTYRAWEQDLRTPRGKNMKKLREIFE